jgi:hypothetical protein
VTPEGPGFSEVPERTQLADESGNHFGSFSEHRFSNDGMRGLPLNPISESFGVLGHRCAADSYVTLRPATAEGQFNGFVMGLR